MSSVFILGYKEVLETCTGGVNIRHLKTSIKGTLYILRINIFNVF